MAISRATHVLRAARLYSTQARAQQTDRLGAAIAISYWCAVVSGPFVGAYIISNAAKDKAFANMYAVLSIPHAYACDADISFALLGGHSAFATVCRALPSMIMLVHI